MNGRSSQMRQVTTAEVRLDIEANRQATHCFGYRGTRRGRSLLPWAA